MWTLLEVMMVETGYEDRTRAPGLERPAEHAPQHEASGAMDAVGSAASDTAGTAKQQTREVAGEVKAQARSLAENARGKVATEARGQNDRLAEGVRRFADELDEMVRDRDDSPARGVVSQVSQGGRRVADYLAEHGPDGMLREVQDFARRRPGTFLAVAAAAGFVAGRLGKGVLNAGSTHDGAESPSTYPASSSTTYAGTPREPVVAPVAPRPVTPGGGVVAPPVPQDTRP
jgi:hypothetical protein